MPDNDLPDFGQQYAAKGGRVPADIERQILGMGTFPETATREGIWQRLLDWFDAPRFCPDDGAPIEVERITRYDSRTGKPREWWCWHCPDVDVDYSGGRIRWSQWGNSIHIHGEGRPRWHRRATAT